ncbi:hypothetical protein QTP88_008945 [Uroleucon formosanum]
MNNDKQSLSSKKWGNAFVRFGRRHGPFDLLSASVPGFSNMCHVTTLLLYHYGISMVISILLKRIPLGKKSLRFNNHFRVIRINNFRTFTLLFCNILTSLRIQMEKNQSGIKKHELRRDWREMTSARAPPPMPFLGYAHAVPPTEPVRRRRRDGDHAPSPTTTTSATRVHDRFDFDTHVTYTRHVRPQRFPHKNNGRLGVVCEYSW